MIIDQTTSAIVANYSHLEPSLTSFLFFLNLPLLHFQYTSLAYRFTISRIFVWHCIIRNFKLPVTISAPESLHILTRSCIYFNIIIYSNYTYITKGNLIQFRIDVIQVSYRNPNQNQNRKQGDISNNG
jgi:uncharacterized membrane-anchored protein YitT (DUF2179 family)